MSTQLETTPQFGVPFGALLRSSDLIPTGLSNARDRYYLSGAVPITTAFGQPTPASLPQLPSVIDPSPFAFRPVTTTSHPKGPSQVMMKVLLYSRLRQMTNATHGTLTNLRPGPKTRVRNYFTPTSIPILSYLYIDKNL